MCWELLTHQPFYGTGVNAARNTVMNAAESGGQLPSEVELAADVSRRLGSGCASRYCDGSDTLFLGKRALCSAYFACSERL